MKRSLSTESSTKEAKTKSPSKAIYSKQKVLTPTFSKKTSPAKKQVKEVFRGKFEVSEGNVTKTGVEPEYDQSSKKQKIEKSQILNQNNKKSTGLKFEKKTTQKKHGVQQKKKKCFDELPSDLIGKDGKPKWDKVKLKKKELREKRRLKKASDNQYELSVKAKSLWEKLRKRNLSAEKKEALVNDLFMLLKGQIPNVVHSHDMARVVQWMLKLGSPAVRTSICEELCANTVAYLKSKYACFSVRRALRYGSKTDRRNFILSCQGHFLKLLGNTFACSVVETMYAKFMSAEQRKQVHKEIYGDMHALLSSEVSAIENIPDNMRPAILVSTKINLTKLLAKKHLLKFTLVQSVLYDFLTSCSEQDCTDVLELIQDNILDLLTTKEGARVAMLAVWRAKNKMKKVIVKSLKGKVKEIATSEIGNILLIALFDSIDDTVLIKKALIPELLEGAEELAKNEFGRKVILYLVAHRSPAYFHPQQMKILSKGDDISSRKKDVTMREQEMLEAVSGPLLKAIADDPATWFGESSVAMVSLAIMKSGKGEPLRAAFQEVVNYMLDPNSVVEMNTRKFHVIEHSGTHLVFKKLIQHDKTQPDRIEDSFSQILASSLTENSLNHMIQFNRGCFLLVVLFESMNKKVQKILRSKMTESMKAFLLKQETTGSKILLQKLDDVE